MGLEGALAPKFPKNESRLINGHEGVVWVPDENRFAIVLIRGGDSFDELVSLIDKNEFIKAPKHFYENVIYKKGSPLKSAVIWNKEYLE